MMKSKSPSQGSAIVPLLWALLLVGILAGLYLLVSLPILFKEAIPLPEETTETPVPQVNIPRRLALADQLMEEGKFQLAAEEYDAITRFQAREIKAWVSLSKALTLLNRYPEAVAAAQEALRLDPQNAAAHAHLGLAFDWQGEPEKAIPPLRRAVELAPQTPEAHAYLASAYAEKNQWREALEEGQRAVQLDPANVDAHRNLGYVLEKQAKHQEALDHYQRAVNLRPNYAYLHRDVGRMYRDYPPLKDTAKAIASFQKAIDLEPKEPRNYWGLALVYYKEGNYAAARPIFDQAAEVAPNYAPAFTFSGWSYYLLQDYVMAVERFQRATQLSPNSAQYQAALGWAYLKTGRKEEARSRFQRALELEPEQPLARQGLSAVDER